ncbi:hypothetical protein OHAE_4983 [Ochrobactrum soli]|uniref:Uncharacterized protein n=1 Tax=Ochrobactrum soli TaxID=2448455 RepID=A0A2P9HDP0_9HYPH|nr:hypothetical protein OHAE_4983 [[Ochrobactrum] soli]
MRFLSDIGQSEEACCQLGTDTGWIPHCKRNHARFSAISGHSYPPRLHSVCNMHMAGLSAMQVFCILYAAFYIDG